LGWKEPIDAIDLSRDAEPLFRRLSHRWAGEVRLSRGEASDWLRRQRRRWDVVIEDLTVPGPTVAVKPRVSLEVLPALVAGRLAPRGVAIVNVLPVPRMTWEEVLELLAAPYRQALLVHFDEYENRVLITGNDLPSASVASAQLRAALRSIGSRQSTLLQVRTLPG
jgi:hypothetical protein